MKHTKKSLAALAATAGILLATGCSSDADVVSENISKASDQFEINRRIIFFNGITDKYLMTIEGKCSIDTGDAKKLVVTCKTGDDAYKKHYLGLSDNVTYFVEQLDSAKVSKYHYRVIFKPETVIPDVDRP